MGKTFKGHPEGMPIQLTNIWRAIQSFKGGNMDMSDTSGTLALIAGILFIICFIAFLALGAIWLMLYMTLAAIDPMIALVLMMLGALFLVMGILDLIFAILCFKWRHDPVAHRTGLIIVGIIGLFTGAGISGILAIVAGAIAKEAA